MNMFITFDGFEPSSEERQMTLNGKWQLLMYQFTSFTFVYVSPKRRYVWLLYAIY